MELKIQKWDEKMTTFKRNKHTVLEPFTMLVIAPRGGGKSTIIRYFFEQILYKHFDMIFVFCESLINEWYQQFIPGKTKFEDYDPIFIKFLFSLQKQRKKELKPPLNLLVIMDDIADKSTVLYDQYINKLFTRGRHWYISTIFASQDISMINMTWRKNVTHLITFRLMGPDLEKLIDNFIDALLNDNDVPEHMKRSHFIKQILNYIFEEDYRALFMIFKDNGKNIFDFIYTYKALYKKSWAVRYW